MKKRSKFSLSHYKLATLDMGKIVPVGLTEVLPGDTIQQATSAFIRVTPLAAPLMHPVHVSIHHWYVPLRLIWDDFESFITGGEDGLDDSVYPTLKAPAGGFEVGSLADYLGVPTKVANLEVSALPFRAYDLIFNEWYRDEDLVEPLVISTESGEDTTTSTSLQAHAWNKDYFTSARPWPQKGPAVSVPVNLSSQSGFTIVSDGTVPTYSVKASYNSASVTASGPVWSAASTGHYGGSSYGVSVTASANSITNQSGGQTGQSGTGTIDSGPLWDNPGLKLDVSSGTSQLGSVDINQLREAFALQRFEEHRALYGSRYTEYLRYLGIRASDARLQRPEYLGGGRQTIQFSEVLQTAEGTDPVGSMRGHGMAAMRTNRYRRFIEEHGLVLSFMIVQPISVYVQSLPRLWNRRFKEDFWQKELEHIGEQEVLNKELYAQGNDQDNETFGYQDRYDEYRSHESSVSGEFRTILNYWHMARIFENMPTLSQDFIYGTPTNRVFMEQTQNQLYCMINHSIQARRLVSRRGTPI